MLPILHLALGNLHVAVSTYALALLGASVAGGVVFHRRCPPDASPAAVASTVAVAAFLGARGVALLLHGSADVGWALGGLSSTGALAAGLVAAVAVARASGTPASALLDALAPAGLVAFAVGRLGCFLAGCCYGRPTSLPWGVVLRELGPPARHPVQLYEAAGDLLLATLATRRGPPGTVARRAAVGYGLLRAGLECWRDPAASDLVAAGRIPLAPAVALVLAAVAAHPCALRGLRLCLGRSRSAPPFVARRNPANGRREAASSLQGDDGALGAP